MAISCNQPPFYSYFKENMDGLGLSAPENLFGTLSSATGTAATILSQIDKFGKAVTVAEVIGAATVLEKLGVAGTLSASSYVGAVIGSLAVDTGRYAGCGASIADVVQYSISSNLYRPWLKEILMEWPGINNRQIIGRNMYTYQARLA